MAKTAKERSADLYIGGVLAGLLLAFVTNIIVTFLICNNTFLTYLLYLIEVIIICILYKRRYTKIKGPFILFIISWILFSLIFFSLFSLGLDAQPITCGGGGVAQIGNTCVGSWPEYNCTGPTYSHTTGNIIITISQSAGITWEEWAVLYAPQGTPEKANGVPNLPFVLQLGSLASGQTALVTLPVTGQVPARTTTAGSIWVCYATTSGATMITGIGNCTVSSGSITYTEIATVTARAT